MQWKKLPLPHYVVEMSTAGIYNPKDLLILSQLFDWHFGTEKPIMEFVAQNSLRVSVYDYEMSKPIEDWMEKQTQFFEGIKQLGLIESWHVTRMPSWEKNNT